VTEDMQAIAAGMWVSGASMTQIAVAVGSNRNIVAGRIMRLRAADDSRWAPRSKPESTRLSARRRRAIKAGVAADAARVAIPNAGAGGRFAD
jgi:hypothetical protein